MELEAFLEGVYAHYNDPKYIRPDPLEKVVCLDDPGDREIAGFIASSLALGNVKAMVPAIDRVLHGCSLPGRGLLDSHPAELTEEFRQFKYRFFTGQHIVHLITAIRRVLEEHGSIESCFIRCYRAAGEDILGGLTRFSSLINRFGENRLGILVPSPGKGSACKRLFLYLRWMVRRDAVDPGHWEIPAAKLIVPLDTHMLNISRRIGITSRKQANLKTALEITEAFRCFSPEDPVKYDFSLTRFGIRPDLDLRLILPDYCNDE